MITDYGGKGWCGIIGWELLVGVGNEVKEKIT